VPVNGVEEDATASPSEISKDKFGLGDEAAIEGDAEGAVWTADEDEDGGGFATLEGLG